jgi:hypothetical protein
MRPVDVDVDDAPDFLHILKAQGYDRAITRGDVAEFSHPDGRVIRLRLMGASAR